MKTVILQCLQQFSSKNSKNGYHDQILKKLKLQCQCKILQNVRFSLLITRFIKNAILQCMQEFSSKNSKNVYQDQILKNFQITVLVQNCAKCSF